MITIKKLHKKYGKRKIQVFEDNKLYGEISEFWHWICIDPKLKVREGEEFEEKEKNLRMIAMENLFWLMHSDHINEDYTEFEAWEEKINGWDRGKVLGPVNENPTSLFTSDEEKEIALNSINNI